MKEYTISINILPLLIIILIKLSINKYTNKIKEDEFKKDLSYAIDLFACFSIMIGSDIYKNMSTNSYVFFICLCIILLVYQLTHSLKKSNKKVNFVYRKFIYTLFILIALMFMAAKFGPLYDYSKGTITKEQIMRIQNVYNEEEIFMSKTEERGYIGTIIVCLILGLIIICFNKEIYNNFKKTFKDNLNIKTEEDLKYNKPVEDASDIQRYYIDTFNGEKVVIFYKCIIEKEYWDYWKNKSPDKLKEYNDSSETLIDTRILLYNFNEEIKTIRTKLDEFRTYKILPVHEFAVNNDILIEADKKSNTKEIKDRFLKIREDVLDYIIKLDFWLQTCNLVMKDIEKTETIMLDDISKMFPGSNSERTFYFADEDNIFKTVREAREIYDKYITNNQEILRHVQVANKSFKKIHKNSYKKAVVKENPDLFKENEAMSVSHLSKEEIEYISNKYLE